MTWQYSGEMLWSYTSFHDFHPRLKDNIVMSDAAQPIQLPGPNTTTIQSTAVVTGWGGVYPHDPDSYWYQQQRLSCHLMETLLY